MTLFLTRRRRIDRPFRISCTANLRRFCRPPHFDYENEEDDEDDFGCGWVPPWRSRSRGT